MEIVEELTGNLGRERGFRDVVARLDASLPCIHYRINWDNRFMIAR